MTKAWTIVATKAYLNEYNRLWVDHPEHRAAIRKLDLDLKNHRPELDLFIERSADRLRADLWILPHSGLEILLKLVPGDRMVTLEWIRRPSAY